nr:FCD domain-containing protein [Boseongicola sp. H5]
MIRAIHVTSQSNTILVGGSRDSERTIYREIASAITRGELSPGTRLPTERALAESYGVSRNLVRLALDQLEADCKIERKVGAGTFVTDPDVPERPTWLRDAPDISPMGAIEARRVIEVGAVELAVARATDEDLDRIESGLRAMEAAETASAFRAAAFTFHLEFIRATHNPLLVSMYELLIAARAKTGWNRLGYLVNTEEERERSCLQGREFLEALRNRDATAAARFRDQNLAAILARITDSGRPT